MMNQLKNLMLLRLLILVIQSKKNDYDTKIQETEKKITDHDHSNKYFTTQNFIKLTSENFVARLAQANLASKNDIAVIVKKTDFDDKIKNLNKIKSHFKQNKTCRG